MFSIKKLSRLTGATYLAMAPLGVLGILYIPSAILVDGDMATTIQNVVANNSMFHLSIFAALAVQLIQIILVLLLYKLFKPVSKIAAVLMVAFIIPAVSIAMLNDVNLLTISAIATGASFAANFTVEQVEGLVGMLFSMHQAGVMVAQIFWGIWLFPMGYLAYRSGFVPRIIGVLLMIGCFGYLADSLLFVLGVQVGFTVSEYTFIGEVLLPLWLLFRAGTVEQRYRENYEATA